MPYLTLQRADGSREDRELSRSQPLSVGRQPFNDVCVPEDDVQAMHCRISWNKTTFEVTAATGKGVEVNGYTVAHAALKPGDVIRVGSLDLIYADPVAVESPHFAPAPPIPASKPPAAEPRSSRDEKPKPQSQPEARPVEDLSLFEGPVYTQSQELAVAEFDHEHDEPTIGDKPPKWSRRAESPASKPLAGTKPGRPVLAVPPGRRRPGEQDVLSSPLVLGLSIGGVVLLLVTGIFWFLTSRERATRLYDSAVAEMAGGQYVQSIASFETFVQQYPRHALRKQAERELDKARVRKEITGGSPAWKLGLEQLQKLISDHRHEPDFADLHPTLFQYGEEIALGAAKTADSARDATLLIVSDEARAILERYADPTIPPTAAIARIQVAKNVAEGAIGKQNTFDAAIAAVEAALANKQPMAALAEREKLVRRFSDYAQHKRVKVALQKALDLERSVIATDETEQLAETNDDALPAPGPVLGVFHTRTRTDEAPQGRVAFVMGKDCCYAVDTVTGELVWRRAIGFNPPFFPVLAAGSQPSVLLFDGPRQSLLCCQPATGKLIWRQKLGGRPRSAPLVHESQIYLPTADQSLCRIDLETGRLTARVTFSQNVLGPPALSHDGNHLLIPGDMAMIYALSMRPLAPAATTFTDHAAGSLSAPPLALGKLLLLCENDKADSANLRLWDAGKPQTPLTELTAKAFRVRGQVRESPVLRGNQLVVPSSGEQLAAFSVTDEAGREGLAPVAQYRVREDEEIEKRRAADPASKGDKDDPDNAPRPAGLIGSRVPLYVALGSDRQFWAASSAFRRFEIGADSIHMDSNALAIGIASQRLQQIGDQFFVARKAAFHDAVIFSAVDRDRMVSPWRTVLGAQLLELVPARDGGAVGLSEAGHVVLLGTDRLRQGGIDLKGAVELELPGRINQRLVTSTLHDGRMFLAAVGDVTRLWIIGLGGQIDLNSKLAKAESVQAGAVLVDEGLVVALPGRLKLVSVTANKKSVQDWLAPVGENPSPPWKHLVRLAGDEVLACNGVGLLSRIQVRTSDVPHLAETAKLQLGAPVDVAPSLRGDALLVADASKLVQQLNWRTFDQDGKRQFAATVRGLWPAGSSWLVWTNDHKLHALSEERDLPIRWSLDLKDLEPAGPPVEAGGQLWIACRNGTVLAVDAATGTESRRIQLPQALTLGLKKLDDGLFAVSCDGALYRLNLTGGQ